MKIAKYELNRLHIAHPSQAVPLDPALRLLLVLYPQEVLEQLEGRSHGLPTHGEQKYLEAQGSAL